MRRVLVLCLWTLAAGSAWAGSGKPELMQQRELFLRAEQAIQAGDLSTWRRLEPRLREYPLYPYLRYAELTRRLGSVEASEVQAFISAHADTPLATRLQHAWLRQLARKGTSAELVGHFQPLNDTDLRCRHAAALLPLDRERALAKGDELWLVGRSQPASCDPVFAALDKAGRLNAEQVWARIELAMSANNAGLARYLGRHHLAAEERLWLERWLQVRRDPQTLLKADWIDAEHRVLGAIVAEGLRRLAGQDPVLAAQKWLSLHRAGLSALEQARVTRSLAVRLARASGPEAQRQLERLAGAVGDPEVMQWYIVSTLVDGDWSAALRWMDRLPEAEATSTRWRYWRGRALEALGQPQAAEQLYHALSSERDFYGFIAADRIGSGYSLAAQPVAFTPAELQVVARLPGLLRAREMLALERIIEARREWHHTLTTLDARELQLAARLAHEWGWHDRVIYTLAQARYWDDLELRFPVVHQDLVVTHAERARINPAWAFAVIRQESAFAADARSSAGAVGLMQLMPATARLVARQIGLGKQRLDLTDVPTNIRLGVAYLEHMGERFDGHPVLSTAAYNAGPFRVEQWIPSERDMPADLWIETVPFSETRDYMKRVLAYTIIYEQRLGRTPGSIAEYLRPIPSRATLMAQVDDRDT